MIRLLLALLACSVARADPADLDAQLAIWGSASWEKTADSALNPGNLVAQLPADTELVEARPDATLSWEQLRFVARPRFRVETTHADLFGGTLNRTHLLLRWVDGYASWSASDFVTITYGLQNFQWGPAESASPSNRVFRDFILQKDFLYEVRGEHLARVNLTPKQNWSEVLLVELSGNGDPEPEANTPFSRKGLLKSEISWDGGADYAGLVNGWRDAFGWWVGEYANFESVGGLTFYADLEEQKGSSGYYPVVVPTTGAVALAQSRRYDDNAYLFAVSGARYALENGDDLRLEWIYQQNGYTSSDTRSVASALSSRAPAQLVLLANNLTDANASGLDFPGRQFGYASFRIPDLLSVRNWNFYARDLQALEDSSSFAYLSSENAVGDHGTFFAAAGAGFGPNDSELKSLVKMAASMGYRQIW